VDFADAHGLWTILNTVQELEQVLGDTELVAGSEAYQAALVFYHSAKTAATQDVPGGKVVYDELKTRFPGGKRKSGETETETVTKTVKREVKVS
jgi:hypothetical protein